MSDAVVLQYVGFETKGAIREYTFTLRGTGGASSEYFVTIANDAFVAHRVRYQDAPEGAHAPKPKPSAYTHKEDQES